MCLLEKFAEKMEEGKEYIVKISIKELKEEERPDFDYETHKVFHPDRMFFENMLIVNEVN